MDRLGEWVRALQSIPRRYIGAGAGFFLWVLFEWMGFFPVLLLCALMAIGYAVGRFADGRDHWQQVIERIWQTDRFDR
ncbi:MAG: DUF2273 domain-containing protein [Firmicutes bacterium]|nr:DUF2273 domain-containing protein [Bacillota bacterium]